MYIVTLIYLTGDDYDKEISFINLLHNGRADGIIMSVSGEAAKEHSYLHKLKTKHIPLVFFDRIYEDIEAASVTTNDYESSFAATEHLILTGCKKIAFLVINKNLSIGKTRLQGYVDALTQYKIPYQHELVIDCSNNNEENAELLKHIFTELKPDGVFASVERLAISTYYVCQELNISIPGQLKVICFSSLEISSLLNPSLTTITQPAFAMGTQAANLLFKALEDATDFNPHEHIVLQSELIIRKSTST